MDKKYAYMTQNGAVVVTAKSKKEALDKFRETNPDVRLEDIYRYN